MYVPIKRYVDSLCTYSQVRRVSRYLRFQSILAGRRVYARFGFDVSIAFSNGELTFPNSYTTVVTISRCPFYKSNIDREIEQKRFFDREDNSRVELGTVKIII